MKELSDIAWNVDEPTYRADPALSYSTLARYEREGGFSSLPTLFDKQSSSSLTFGSMVDTLLTGSEEDFANQFIVVDDPNISDTLKDIAYDLVDKYREAKTYFDNIPDDVLAEVGKAHDFWANDKYIANRVKQIRQNCKTYYSILMTAEDKTIVSPQDIADARRCASALKSSSKTSFLFADNDPFDERYKRYYQLKFKGTDPESGVKYRSMADLILVDYQEKVIYPYDLKTSSHDEWKFGESFTKWRYDLQARLYWRNIRQTLDNDDFFKDFRLENYSFIVVNRRNCKPLVWSFDKTKDLGTINITKKSGYTYVWRDPYTIGKELDYYLKNNCEFPVGIHDVNDLVTFIENN